MNIKKIKLQNFKCFEKIDVDCKKITLLTGANSSGKSSVLNGLLGAFQTTRYPFFYSPNGDYVNMGDYSEVSFNHIRNREIGIGIDFDDLSGSSASIDARFREDAKTRQPKLGKLIFDSASFKLSLEGVDAHYEGTYSYSPGEVSGTHKEMQGILAKFASEIADFIKKQPDAHKRKKQLPPTDIVKLIFEPSEGKVRLSGQFEVAAPEGMPVVELQIEQMASMFSRMNREFNYVSSFRHPPERTYYRRTKAALKVGRYGENHIDQIVEWEQSKSKEFRALVKCLQELKLLNELHTKTFPGGRFDIKVKPGGASVETSLIDVGFGVSQFLPIVVADLQLGKGATVAISQPEIHLHPSAQSLLGDYFLKNTIDNDKRYIIETHSEYLVNKFRALIAKGSLAPDDVSVYYLRKTSDRSESFRITFTKDGKIEGAPKDFFDTYMCDVMEIALNA